MLTITKKWYASILRLPQIVVFRFLYFALPTIHMVICGF